MRKCIQDIIPIYIPLDPKLCILGIEPVNHTVTRQQQSFLDIGFLLDKRAIALLWKNAVKPTARKWILELSITLPLEKITYLFN